MQRFILRLSLLLLLALTTITQANWPRFQGPNGTGTANNQNLPIKWTEENILWKVKLPGVGHSSPIVWEDKLFVQSASKDGKQRMLVCVNAKSGKTVWVQTVTGIPAHHRRDNSWASATPATDGKLVYAAIWNGKGIVIHAWDFSGDLKWKTPVGSFLSQHGAGASPVVHEDKVFFSLDQDRADADVPTKSSALIALDASTGKQLWRTPLLSFRASYAAPMILEEKGEDPQIIVASTRGVQSFDPKDGEENWSYTWTFYNKPLRSVASPIYTHGLILATSGDGGGDRHAIAVKAGGKGDITKNGLAWELTKETPYVPCPLAKDDYIFGVHDGGFAVCFEAKTGKLIWKERIASGRTAVYSSPVLVDGNVYVASTRGQVSVFSAAKEFKLLAKNDLGEDVMASPAVANKCLYIRGTEHLFCIGKK